MSCPRALAILLLVAGGCGSAASPPKTGPGDPEEADGSIPVTRKDAALAADERPGAVTPDGGDSTPAPDAGSTPAPDAAPGTTDTASTPPPGMFSNPAAVKLPTFPARTC